MSLTIPRPPPPPLCTSAVQYMLRCGPKPVVLTYSTVMYEPHMLYYNFDYPLGTVLLILTALLDTIITKSQPK